jgi:uncharacterized protein with NAD-binding domain and iron-sulfur cluster
VSNVKPSRPDLETRPIEVAIVGGGCAAIATAFELTRPELKSRYRVTVYQVGWRLGGKGASGRGPAGRIEEHGLHLWMGFYENAFRLTRECYRELGRAPGSCPIVDWQDAFYPAPHAGLTDQSASGAWSIWTALLPPGGGLPGDPGRKAQQWTVADYIVRSLSLIGALLERLAGSAPSPASQPGGRSPSLLEGSPDAIVSRLVAILGQLGPLASSAGILEATRLLQVLLGMMPADASGRLRVFYERIQDFYRAIEVAARQQLRAVTSTNDELRRVWEIADILLAVVRGSLSEGLIVSPNGFDAIDDEDCRSWLRKHGASEESLNGAFVRGLHDLALAYENGDPGRMEFSAGQGLRGSFRAFFNYRGSFFWKMRAGMGDVVFAPFYEVLKRRGVRFEFFHRLRDVRLADSPVAPGTLPHVEALEFDVQADTVGGRSYEPLVDVRGLPCWPSQPDWRQLVDGLRLSKRGVDFEAHGDRHRVRRTTLRVATDFDFAVLAVGGGAVPHVCRALIEREPRWQAMVAHLKTVPTQAFQIWMNQDMSELGWSGPALSSLSAFVHPFGTWADMTQLVPLEDWPTPPRSIAYFCGVLEPGRDLEADAQRARVRDAAVRFLNHDVVKLWPRGQRPSGRFRWDLLVDPVKGHNGRPPRRANEGRFASQFWTANVNPSDRYVQSTPGSAKHRISPLDQHFDNLTVAGDWTNTGLNIGCVEAAFMSGRLAAHALARFPALEDIAGFDHP